MTLTFGPLILKFYFCWGYVINPCTNFEHHIIPRSGVGVHLTSVGTMNFGYRKSFSAASHRISPIHLSY